VIILHIGHPTIWRYGKLLPRAPKVDGGIVKAVETGSKRLSGRRFLAGQRRVHYVSNAPSGLFLPRRSAHVAS
jgi:hypothetical protein